MSVETRGTGAGFSAGDLSLNKWLAHHGLTGLASRFHDQGCRSLEDVLTFCSRTCNLTRVVPEDYIRERLRDALAAGRHCNGRPWLADTEPIAPDDEGLAPGMPRKGSGMRRASSYKAPPGGKPPQRKLHLTAPDVCREDEQQLHHNEEHHRPPTAAVKYPPQRGQPAKRAHSGTRAAAVVPSGAAVATAAARAAQWLQGDAPKIPLPEWVKKNDAGKYVKLPQRWRPAAELVLGTAAHAAAAVEVTNLTELTGALGRSVEFVLEFLRAKLGERGGLLGALATGDRPAGECGVAYDFAKDVLRVTTEGLFDNPEDPRLTVQSLVYDWVSEYVVCAMPQCGACFTEDTVVDGELVTHCNCCGNDSHRGRSDLSNRFAKLVAKKKAALARLGLRWLCYCLCCRPCAR